MKISFVLPIYNEQTTLANCINSLLKQKDCDFEILACDDCSTDHSLDILKTFHNKIQIIPSEKERKGAAFIRNKLNKLATGDIIAVCDCDEYYDYRGKAIIEAFEKNPVWGVFYSSLHLKDVKDIHITYLQEAYKWDFKSKCNISHPTVAYRREHILNHPYHEISKETDLFEFMLLDMNKAGIEFGGCQEPIMIKYENRQSRNLSESKELKTEMYNKYGINI